MYHNRTSYVSNISKHKHELQRITDATAQHLCRKVWPCVTFGEWTQHKNSFLRGCTHIAFSSLKWWIQLNWCAHSFQFVDTHCVYLSGGVVHLVLLQPERLLSETSSQNNRVMRKQFPPCLSTLYLQVFFVPSQPDAGDSVKSGGVGSSGANLARIVISHCTIDKTADNRL